MASYEIVFSRSVRKDFRPIPPKDVAAILRRINTLGKDPWPAGCEKLAGTNHFRVRQGKYRIIYDVMEDKLVVLIVKVAHRKRVYRAI